MEADEGSTGSSCGENVFVGMVREKSWNGTLWDRAVYIFRDAYTSFYRYGYAVLWSQVSKLWFLCFAICFPSSSTSLGIYMNRNLQQNESMDTAEIEEGHVWTRMSRI